MPQRLHLCLEMVCSLACYVLLYPPQHETSPLLYPLWTCEHHFSLRKLLSPGVEEVRICCSSSWLLSLCSFLSPVNNHYDFLWAFHGHTGSSIYIYIYTSRGRSVGSVQLLNVFTKKINKSMSRSK